LHLATVDVDMQQNNCILQDISIHILIHLTIQIVAFFKKNKIFIVACFSLTVDRLIGKLQGAAAHLISR
jgi:hypothetical protein